MGRERMSARDLEHGEHQVVVTPSGVHAMLDRATGELMHPTGPLIEAERIYVTPARLATRLSIAHAAPLLLLDVGLGAGSNAIAAWRVAEESLSIPARRLEIVSFDRSVAALELALAPEHAPAFGFDGGAAIAASQLLTTHRHDGARTSWRLRLGDVVSELAREQAASADVVFWDPFSIRANPSLWTVAAFSALRRVCRAGATVHTYSGATATRTALLLAGFAVGFGEAAAGMQKQTTVAATRAADLAKPLDRRWLEGLAHVSRAWPADPPHDALARIATAPQFRG
jgi:queuine tRNA-ribosyltransferase